MNTINKLLTAIGSDYEYHTLAGDIASYERNLARVSTSVVVVYCDVIIITKGITD